MNLATRVQIYYQVHWGNIKTEMNSNDGMQQPKKKAQYRTEQKVEQFAKYYQIQYSSDNPTFKNWQMPTKFKYLRTEEWAYKYFS